MAEKRAQLVTLGTLEKGLTRLKREYLAAIAGAGYASFRKAETVPGADEAKADVLYLVQDKASGLYGIWALVDGAMVQVGSTAVDLDGYVTREELDGVKADKSEGVAVVIPTTGWSQDSGVYPYYYDIPADGVTAKDRADLALAPASIAAAAACGVCPATETLAGVIRVRAAKTPEAEMSGEYWVMKGKG